jgi:hypothetical protein
MAEFAVGAWFLLMAAIYLLVAGAARAARED